MISLHPILDKELKFAFFSNNKVCQTSINRHALKHRAIVRKDDSEEYDLIVDQFLKTPNLFRFTVVRNPFDKVVSAFSYLRSLKKPKIDPNLSFEGFMCGPISEQGVDFDPHFNIQHDRAYYEGKQFVDFIAKHETINHDWLMICRNMGHEGPLPHANKSSHANYRSMYSKSSKRVVEELYSQDIAAFGYEF